MKKQKLVPLAILAAVILLLALALAALQSGETADKEEISIPLCTFTPEEIDGLSYSGNNMDVALLKGREGNWMLSADPTLPLDQTAVDNLVEEFAALNAQRALLDEERGELPERSDVPLMRIEITAGEQSLVLVADQLNEVADVYYVYDEAGSVYTVDAGTLRALYKEPRQFYAPQTLTEQSAGDAVWLQVNDLMFVCTDGVWTLAEEPEFALDQEAVQKMVNTLCELKTKWSITAPDGDYGLENPDVTAVLGFADGTSLTVRFGALKNDEETLCYLESDSAPGVVYEVDAAHKSSFAVSKETLAAQETDAAQPATDDIIAEVPVGGPDDYAN
ncbi:MAG: DUF4340 domain-containing protein [Gemmiger sp.]